MANARSIINKACRKLHVLGRGQTLSAEEVTTALETLNDMLGTLSMDSGYIFNSEREVFSLTGAASYTIGTGGTFNTTKPVTFEAVFVRIGSTDYPLKQINSPEYADISFKEIQGIPEAFFFENDTPLGRIYLYPVGVTGSLHIWSQKPLTEFTDLTTDYSLPNGAVEMLLYNLAVRLAPEYELPVPVDVSRMAKKTLENMQVYNKRHNYPVSKLNVTGKEGQGNIYSGWLSR